MRMATGRKSAAMLCLMAAILAITTRESTGTEQNDQRWSQRLDTSEEHIDSYPFLTLPQSESFIPNRYYPYTTNEEYRPDEDSLAAPPAGNSVQSDFSDYSSDLYSNQDNSNNIFSNPENANVDVPKFDETQEKNLFSVPSDSNWPSVYPNPILRYWFRKADYVDTTTDDSTDETTDVTTDVYDSTTDSDFTSTEETPTSTGYDDPTDDDGDQDDAPDDSPDDAGDDQFLSASDEVDNDPAVVVPPGSFFMHCLIHLMVGVCIALGADVWMVGRKRREADDFDGNLSELQRLFDDAHAAEIMNEGLNFGSQGRRERCIQRAACLEPRQAQLYVKTTEAISRLVPEVVLGWIDADSKTFATMARELRRGAKKGNTGANCVKQFPCDHMDRLHQKQKHLSAFTATTNVTQNEHKMKGR